MKKLEIIVGKDLEPFVNSIMVEESNDQDGHFNMPLYADGYPGIMFQQSEQGFHLLPKGKKLSEFFLYGQTLAPVSLDVKGPFKFIVFQLYPFASRYLLGVDPRELNDECFDLLQLKQVDVEMYRKALVDVNGLPAQVEVISELMRDLIKVHRVSPDDRIHAAISHILDRRGQITIRELREHVPLSERSFERNFVARVGLTPKQFARIVQFQCALRQLNQSNFGKLTDIGLDSGFADQSHFIRTFRKYTGQTPSFYLRQLTSA